MLLLLLTNRLEVVAGTQNRCSFVPPPGETALLHYIEVIPDADTAADNTNYASLRFFKGDGTGTPIHAARPTTVAGGALTRGSVIKIGPATSDTSRDPNLPAPTIDFTAALGQRQFTSTDPLTFQVTHAGSGAAVKATINVWCQRLRKDS